MNELDFLVDDSLKLHEKFYFYCTIQSKLFLNNLNGRIPNNFESYEALILSSFLTLRIVKESYFESYPAFERKVYHELRNINDIQIISELTKIGEEDSFINSRFFLYNSIFSDDQRGAAFSQIIDKLYVNPLTASDYAPPIPADLLNTLRLESIFSTGYKHFTSTIVECFKILKQYEEDRRLQNPYSKIFSDLNFGSFGLPPESISFIKPISTQQTTRSINERTQTISPHFLQKIFLNHETEFSYYMKFLNSKEALLFVLYGYPIIKNVDMWFNQDHPRVFRGNINMPSHSIVEISFHLGKECLYFDGILSGTTFSGKFGSEFSRVVYQKEVLKFKPLNNILDYELYKLKKL